MSVRLRDVHQVWRLDWSSREGGGQRFDTVAKARRFLDRWRSDAAALSSMRALLARGAEPVQWLTDDEVLRRCAEALSRGRMRAWSVVLLRVDDLARGEAEDEADEAPEQASLLEEKTWIEIELTDMEGNPMPGERYWIKLPDDTVREGALDRLGRAYFGGLDPGECEIRWPDLDDEATVDRPPVAPPTPPAPKDWIEVELTGDDGSPIAGARYWIKSPDGKVHEGRLDAEGRARVDGIPAGQCEVRWPDLDDEAAVQAPPPGPTASPRATDVEEAQGEQPEDEAVDEAPVRDWIEIELTGVDGTPLPRERYWIKLPDGKVREGRTDAQGRARFDGVDPGQCEVRWPDVDDSAMAQ